MTVQDRIYGEQTISDPVVVELINSAPLTRLKNINQAGPSQYLYPWKNISRLEHSIGVMLLLRKFGAALEEQIAGLLHDVPHTAFSHVADFVFANEKHEFHELFHEKVINDSEIPQILKKYDISDAVIHPHEFHLLERNLPDLCGDRIDYALRDSFCAKPDRHRTNKKLGGIIVHNNEFVFAEEDAAMLFAMDYLETDRNSWAHPREAAAYELLAQAIAHALDKKILTMRDMFTDDKTVFRHLKEFGDAYVQKKLAYLTPAFRIEAATKQSHHLFVKTKIRAVDPKIVDKTGTRRLSTVSTTYRKLMEEHLESGNKGWYLNVYTS